MEAGRDVLSKHAGINLVAWVKCRLVSAPPHIWSFSALLPNWCGSACPWSGPDRQGRAEAFPRPLLGAQGPCAHVPGHWQPLPVPSPESGHSSQTSASRSLGSECPLSCRQLTWAPHFRPRRPWESGLPPLCPLSPLHLRTIIEPASQVPETRRRASAMPRVYYCCRC